MIVVIVVFFGGSTVYVFTIITNYHFGGLYILYITPNVIVVIVIYW